MHTLADKQESHRLEELIEAQARGEQPATLDLPVEQDAPHDAELDTRVSKYGQGASCMGVAP